MKKDEKFARITITLPPDLAKWVKEKEASLNNRDRRLKTSASAIIADAVEEMRSREELGNANPQSEAANVIQPSETSVGGSSTPLTTRYRKAGKAK